jgi:hypothetical protein
MELTICSKVECGSGIKADFGGEELSSLLRGAALQENAPGEAEAGVSFGCSFAA